MWFSILIEIKVTPKRRTLSKKFEKKVGIKYLLTGTTTRGHRGLVGLFVNKLIRCQGSRDRIPVVLLLLFGLLTPQLVIDGSVIIKAAGAANRGRRTGRRFRNVYGTRERMNWFVSKTIKW